MGRYITGLILVGTLLASSAFSPTARAEAEVTYKGSTVAPNPSPWAQLLSRYKKLVRKASDKKIKVKLAIAFEPQAALGFRVRVDPPWALTLMIRSACSRCVQSLPPQSPCGISPACLILSFSLPIIGMLGCRRF